MTFSSYSVKDTLTVNGAFQANASGVYFSNTLVMNSSVFTGTSNNANYLNGSTAFVNATGQFTFTNTITHTGSLVVSGSLSANSNIGSGGQVLASNASTPYWTSLAPSATTDTTNATNITTGSMSTARISGLATSATTDTTNATNISAGTLTQARLANVLFTNTYSQLVTGGAIVTSASIATGNVTANSGLCPLQYITNNGAFTITAPPNDGSLVILMTNAGSASTVTFSGFTVGASTGDSLDSTNGHMFMIFIVRINAYSTYSIKALQ